jgi:hypothetical protein
VKQSALLLAAALAGAGVVLASRPAEEDAAPAPAPPAVQAQAAATPAVVVPPAMPACDSGQRMAEWELLSSGVGGYREAGFAVLHHPQRGTITVTEGVDFDHGLLLQRVTPDSVRLRCGTGVRDLATPTADGAAPAMRAALPDPDRSTSH